MTTRANRHENSVMERFGNPHSIPGDCKLIVRFLTDEHGSAIRDEQGHGVQAEYGMFLWRSRVVLSTCEVHPADVDDPRFWQFCGLRATQET